MKNPELVWRHIDTTGDCWLWTGYRNRNGYGIVTRKNKGDRKFYRATRIVWELTYGPIPNGMFVCHACDNPPCCRPDHLFLGTPLDNTQDALRKGRFDYRKSGREPKIIADVYRQRGELHTNAKLKDVQRREISQLYRSGKVSQEQLAEQYGVSRTTVRNAIKKY